MKPLLLILILHVTCAVGQTRQAREVFNKKNEVTWLGLDFSEARFVGDSIRLALDADVIKLIWSWNDLMITEADKYHVNRAMHRSIMKTSLDVTIEHNKTLEVRPMVTENNADWKHFDNATVQNIVSSYDFRSNKGIGMMFIVESFTKTYMKSSIWVTYIDMDIRQVIFTENLMAKTRWIWNPLFPGRCHS